ncbi:MAG: ABC transporter substrate-binding protein [Deltaproteobacteria bacterium]
MEKYRRCILGLLFLTVLSLGSSGLTAAATVQSQGGPIRIGLNSDLTGVFTVPGTFVSKGARAYLDAMGGKVAGREISLIEMDNTSEPKVALEVAKKCVEMDKVHILAGVVHSGSALAVKGYADKVRIPYVGFSMAGVEQLTLDDPSPYYFRTHIFDGLHEIPLGRYAHKKLGYKKMAAMAFDYVGGRGKLWTFKQAFEEGGGKIVQEIYPPLGTLDFAPYFARISSEAEALWIFGAGQDIPLLSQYFEFKLQKRFPLVTYWTMSVDTLMIPKFKENMIGMVTSSHYTLSHDTPENRKFIEAYQAKYHEPPNDYAEGGYTGMMVIRTALEKIGGNIEDIPAFLKALSETRFKAPMGLISFDKNHNVVKDVQIRRVEKVGDAIKNVVLEIVPQVHQPPKFYTIHPKDR